MVRVYLDQAKWVDLANAAQGRPEATRFDDALTVARAAVERGLASFPLSAAHYLETWNRADPRSRIGLASVMSEISRHHTIAGPPALVPAEVEAALHERFGRPLAPRSAQVFGYGASHAFDEPSLGLDYPFFRSLFGLPAPDLRAMVEKALLGGPPANLETVGLGTRPLGDVAERYRQGEEDLAARIAAHGASHGERERTIAASELVDILEPFNAALGRARISVNEFTSLSPEEAEQFLLSMPSRGAVLRLRRLRHENPQHPWTPSDLNDVSYLSIAAVYCDILVTERQWVHLMKRAGLHELYGTRLLSDISDLPASLVANGARTGLN